VLPYGSRLATRVEQSNIATQMGHVYLLAQGLYCTMVVEMVFGKGTWRQMSAKLRLNHKSNTNNTQFTCNIVVKPRHLTDGSLFLQMRGFPF